jgi:uncharacterized protein YndB with AHSA1/START domain
MESATETNVLARELTIAARPETVWKLLADPTKQSVWWGTPLAFEAVPGGPFRVEVIPGHIASGEFVEVDEPTRLVYTWGWEGQGDDGVPPGSTTVEISLVAEDKGTKLTFVHRDLPTETSRDSHAFGWDNYLGRLATAAEGGDPGRDPFLDSM